MTNDKGILIRNIYYMLAYAFTDLKRKHYEDIDKENFEHIYDMFAEILYRGMSMQIKQGLCRTYIQRRENLRTLRGKLNLQGTIKNRIKRDTAIDCEYDELSVDNILNQVLKLTALILIREGSVNNKRRVALRKLMPYFSDVREITKADIHWQTLPIDRHNHSYRLLMNICHFILDGMLMTTEDGKYRMATFSEEHMNTIFERFVWAYYEKHKDKFGISVNSQKNVKWNIDNDVENFNTDFLPSMYSDTVLQKGNRTLIIDTKYYARALYDSQHSSKKKIHSANLYQIFAYVKNYDKEQTGNVAGMLLYAKTSEEITADMTVSLGNNRFWVKNLDLNQDFKCITDQLEKIKDLYLA